MNRVFILSKMLLALVVLSCGKTENTTTENVHNMVDSISISADESVDGIQNQKQEEDVVYTKLATGDTPYKEYYGGNPKCKSGNCSEIKITTSNSDVLVLIKKGEKVVRHAYISANDSYTFSLSNGTYQTFFYYGSGWNSEKEMKNGEIKGGFMNNEDFGKDYPQDLHHSRLEYELILQQNGNFSTSPSNQDEAL